MKKIFLVLTLVLGTMFNTYSQTRNVTFSWSAPDSVFILQYGTDTNFSVLILDTVTTQGATVSLLYPNTYYWHVKGSNNGSSWSSWSTENKFYISSSGGNTGTIIGLGFGFAFAFGIGGYFLFRKKS